MLTETDDVIEVIATDNADYSLLEAIAEFEAEEQGL